MTEPKVVHLNDLLVSGRGQLTVASEETEMEMAHRLEQGARDREAKRVHDGKDKDQSRRHAEVDYWTVRLVLCIAILGAIWLLMKPDASESSVRFAWGLVGSVIGAILGLLKSAAVRAK